MDVLCFGIARDLTGHRSVSIDSDDIHTVADLRKALDTSFPELGRLSVYMIAVNESYALDSDQVKEGDEIAIIPPVSGG
ncbi:MAG: MoaD/ThiS family protein [Bacteroidetes bacterium]|jgi:molybdopterin converting factor subunit 1|nr:MoaD/ThiS family protein [Bacteroidota bacterium]MDA0972274.1 MoaD/ThiS family protein [Bacteroidota bacterium]